MRVLLIDVNCKNSSTGKIVYDLYKGLRADGHAASACYGRGGKINEVGLYKFGLDWETYLHAFLTRLTGRTGCYSWFSTRRLIQYMEAFQPDVVHLHELHAYFVNLKPVLQYLSRKKIPIVWTFHCEFMYTGKCGYAYDCDGWKRGCGNCLHLSDYPKVLFADHTASMYKEKKQLLNSLERLYIACPSQWLAERVKQSFLEGKRIDVVHNGIDTTVFHPVDTEALRMALNIGKNEKVVLAVAPGLMDERKGGAHVLSLAERLASLSVRVIMVGVDEDHIPHGDNVIVKKRTKDQHELVAYYSLADVFVICSKKENFPTTCLEALACGTPVCGYDVGGTKETAPSPLGAFVPHGDMDALVEVVVDMLDKDLSGACRAYAVSEYADKQFFERYKMHYQDAAMQVKESCCEIAGRQ